MKVGSVVYATDQGLGVLSKSFWDAGVVTDVVIMDHHSRENHRDWYPAGTPHFPPRDMYGANIEALEKLCREVDVMLFFETPFHWPLLEYCKRIGKKTVLMPMYECTPEQLPGGIQPSAWLCPSQLDYQYYPNTVERVSKFIPIPVDEHIPYRLRTKAEVFVHNAGNGGLRGRNGTQELLQSLEFVKSPIKLILRSQVPLGTVLEGYPKIPDHVRIDYQYGCPPLDFIWRDGDVFIFPEKFNGLSLPLQEARAAGMLVMCAERFPMTEWLPTGPMIPISGTQPARVSGRMNEFNEAIIDPQSIANTIDEWYGKDISWYSESATDFREEISWKTLKPQYMEFLKP